MFHLKCISNHNARLVTSTQKNVSVAPIPICHWAYFSSVTFVDRFNRVFKAVRNKSWTWILSNKPVLHHQQKQSYETGDLLENSNQADRSHYSCCNFVGFSASFETQLLSIDAWPWTEHSAVGLPSIWSARYDCLHHWSSSDFSCYNLLTPTRPNDQAWKMK